MQVEQGWWWPTSVSRGVFRDLGSARGAISSRLAHHRHQIQGKICKGTKKGGDIIGLGMLGIGVQQERAGERDGMM